MTSRVKNAPTFHFFRDGQKVSEYVGDSYPALEVSKTSHDYSTTA